MIIVPLSSLRSVSIQFTSLILVVFIILAGKKCEVSSQTKNKAWQFSTTQWDNWSGRVAQLGDSCYYPAWLKHAKPILHAMRRYIEVKRNFVDEFKEAKAQKTTTAENPYDYVLEIAQQLHNVRMFASQLIRQQMMTNSTKEPYDIENSGNDPSNLLQLLCEAGELFMCKQIENTEAGTCHCFDVEEVKPFYSTVENDGFCMVASNATCTKLDPAFGSSNNCLDELQCFSYSTEQCIFAFGKTFHCDGFPKGQNIEIHNSYCSRHGHHPRAANDNESSSSSLYILKCYINLHSLVIMTFFLNYYYYS